MDIPPEPDDGLAHAVCWLLIQEHVYVAPAAPLLSWDACTSGGTRGFIPPGRRQPAPWAPAPLRPQFLSVGGSTHSPGVPVTARAALVQRRSKVFKHSRTWSDSRPTPGLGCVVPKCTGTCSSSPVTTRRQHTCGLQVSNGWEVSEHKVLHDTEVPARTEARLLRRHRLPHLQMFGIPSEQCVAGW